MEEDADADAATADAAAKIAAGLAPAKGDGMIFPCPDFFRDSAPALIWAGRMVVELLGSTSSIRKEGRSSSCCLSEEKMKKKKIAICITPELLKCYASKAKVAINFLQCKRHRPTVLVLFYNGIIQSYNLHSTHILYSL